MKETLSNTDNAAPEFAPLEVMLEALKELDAAGKLGQVAGEAKISRTTIHRIKTLEGFLGARVGTLNRVWAAVVRLFPERAVGLPKGILVLQGDYTPEQLEAFRQEWERYAANMGKAGFIPVAPCTCGPDEGCSRPCDRPNVVVFPSGDDPSSSAPSGQ